MYLNGTAGSAKYQGGAKYANGGLWIQNTPSNTEAAGMTYHWRQWDLGMFNKRVGRMFNDNGSNNQAIKIDPFNVTNAFLNYTIKGESYLRGTKIRLAVNNLFDNHAITGVNPFSSKSNVPAPGDVLTLLPARSVSMTMTFGYAPKW